MTKIECIKAAERIRQHAIDQRQARILAGQTHKDEEDMALFAKYMRAAQIRKLTERREFLAA